MSFMDSKIELLGHYVDKDGVYVDEVIVEKVRNAPKSRTRRRFIRS